MNTRQSWIIGAAIVIGCLILSLSLGGRSGAEPKADPTKLPPGAVGRYQLVCQSLVNVGFETQVIDTSTGRVWRRDAVQNKWEDLGSPAQPRK
jgi:hypothetical protein